MKRKSRSITFRISDDSIEKLKVIAEEEKITLNTLVSKTLDSHLEWEYAASRAGFVPTQKSILRDFFDYMPESKLIEIAIRNADKFNEVLLAMQGKIDLDAVLSITRLGFKKSGFAVREFNTEIKANMKLVIQHDMGHNCSIFCKTFIERLLNNAGYPAKIGASDNSLLIEIANSEPTTPPRFSRQALTE